MEFQKTTTEIQTKLSEWKKVQDIFLRAHSYSQDCQKHPWGQKHSGLCSTMLVWCARMDLVQAVTGPYTSAECHKTIVDELARTRRELTSAWTFIQSIKPFGTEPTVDLTVNDPNVDFKLFYDDLRAHILELSTAENKCHLPIMSKIELILADVLTNVSVCEGHHDAQHAFECFMDLRFHVIDGIEIVEHQLKGLKCPPNHVFQHLLNKFRQCDSLHPIRFVTALKQFTGKEIKRIPVGKKVADPASVSLSTWTTLPSLIVPTGATADYAAFYIDLKGAEDDFKAGSCTRLLVAQAAKIMLEYQQQEKKCVAATCGLENIFVYEIRDLLIGATKHARHGCADEEAEKFEKVRKLIVAFIHHKIDVLVAGLKQFPNVFF